MASLTYTNRALNKALVEKLKLFLHQQSVSHYLSLSLDSAGSPLKERRRANLFRSLNFQTQLGRERQRERERERTGKREGEWEGGEDCIFFPFHAVKQAKLGQ